MRGLSWDRVKVRIVALLTLAVMTIPGVATAAPKASTTTTTSTVTYDSGIYASTDFSGPLNYARGVSWS
jgi:hypothetical protein